MGKMDEPRGAIILAGGDSKRLGRPKSLLELGGITLVERLASRLIQYFDQITLVTDYPGLFSHLSLKVTGDILTQYPKTPLRGIHAGLNVSDLPWQFVVACDMPFVDLNLVSFMDSLRTGYDAVVPRIGDYYQPLHAFYSRYCLEHVRCQLENGGGKVTGLYNKIKVRYVAAEEISLYDKTKRSFFNINTWDDLKKAQKYI